MNNQSRDLIIITIGSPIWMDDVIALCIISTKDHNQGGCTAYHCAIYRLSCPFEYSWVYRYFITRFSTAAIQSTM